MARLLRQGGTVLSWERSSHDAQKYSWSRYRTSQTNIIEATFDFDGSHYLGSGVLEAGGVITILAGGGGLYLVSACTHMHENKDATDDGTDGNHQWSFKVSGSEIAAPSMYCTWNSAHVQYWETAGTVTLPIPLDSGDTIEIFGTAWIGADPDTAFFNGVRIGAKS